MSAHDWCPYVHIKEERSWPDAVHVVRGDARKLYVKERECRNVHEQPKGTTVWPAHFKCSECGSMHVSMSYVYFCPVCGARIVNA